MKLFDIIKEHKRLAAGWIVALSLVVLSGVIFVLYFIKSKTDEKARDISSEIISMEEGDLTYNDVYMEVLALASGKEMEETLERLSDPLYMSNKVDVSYLRDVVSTIGMDETLITEVLGQREDTATVSREEFDRIYDIIIDRGNIVGVQKTAIYIDSVGENDNGRFISNGYSEVPCIELNVSPEMNGKIVDVYTKYGTVYKILGLSEESFTIKNVWVYSADDKSCSFISGDKDYTMPVTAGNTVNADRFCDISFTNEGVTGQEYPPLSERGRALVVNDSRIRLEGMAWFTLDENVRIYDISGEKPVKLKSPNMLVGYKEIRLLLDYDDVVKGIIVEDPEIAYEEIRVLLSDSSYEGYDQQEITVSSEGTIEMSIGTEDLINSEIAAGEEMTFKPEDYAEGTVIMLKPASSEDRITINSLVRGSGAPSYRGYIEITREEDGFYIVNGLPIEEYLYSVISSELPSSFDMEAKKALAVCARGYAYNHIEDGTFAAYGANVDDSIMCQVYNNYPETEESIEAVDDTYGVVMTYDGYVIVAYYYSTSAGVTCSNDEIWDEEDEPYLTANIETLDKPEADLSDEADFITFINDTELDTIEKDMPFYRWNIEFTYDEMTKAVNEMLPERLEKSTDWIQVQTGADTFVYKEDLESIGDVKEIAVTERSAGGVAQELIIEGTEATIKVTGRTNILGLMTPKDVEIVPASGPAQTGWTTIPSPTYYVEKTESGFTIHGGGFGHGCGLSQYGADILAKAGYDYRYILMHYYTDIKFDNIYSKQIESEVASESDAEEESE